MELTAVDQLKALGRGTVEWAKTDLKIAIIFMVLGAAISWIANIVIVAVVYDGVGKVPPGAPAVGTTNSVTGSIFWAVAMAVLFGLLAYRMSVGGPKFWRDLRDFPASLAGLLRSDGDTALGHVLWGVAGSMIASAALSAAVSAVFAVGVLALLAGGLRPIVTGLLMLAWRKLIGAVVPDRKKPPTESTFSVVLLGVAAGLAAAYLITNPGLQVLAGVGAAALAFVLTRRQGGASVAVFLLVLGGALLVAVSHELRALAADGGWRENGADPWAWLNGGGYGVITTSAGAGLAGAGGTLAGSTVGGQPQPTEQERYDKYHQAYTKAHGGSDVGFDDWWRQSGFHQTTTMDNVRSLAGQASWLGNVPGQIWENGGTALGQATDAFVKVFTGTVDSVKTAVNFYTSDSPQYQALRDMAAKEGIMPSLEDARQGFVDGVNKWADDMRTALANGDAATVQKMLAEFGGNMLGQAAMGQAGQTGLSMMAKSAQMQALSGLLNDAAANGNPLAKGLVTE
ncbi:MAG: hypothetical protein QOE92_2074, partial [Chloroflexota bacterium]|nr:hypothetical protein [Chloroflexota bacterium]